MQVKLQLQNGITFLEIYKGKNKAKLIYNLQTYKTSFGLAFILGCYSVEVSFVDITHF